MPTPLDALVFREPERWDDAARITDALRRLFAPDFMAPLELDIEDEAVEPPPPEGAVVLVMPLPRELDRATERALTAHLPEPTQARLARFTYAPRRHQSLCGRLLAQRLANLASEAAAGSFFLREQPPEGPALADYDGRRIGRFAIAHTECGVAVSLSRRPMGLDLEVVKPHPRLAGLSDFALGPDFAREIERLHVVDLTRAEEAFLAAWGAIESAQKMNGEDRKSPAASPDSDLLLEKYARAPEADVFWDGGLVARDPEGGDVPIEFLRTPVGALTLLGAPAQRVLYFVKLPPEALLDEFASHVRTFL
ncbi:hypothetical protein [uncultured Sutterella sp.]|uniref:4'-phosphopantetheinyl transferase family protein n=1 Tax=uncultured Sutterella sp. TaxID=286133 RepID=UPI0025DB88F2|nr:hypothetical protein [uncultured Sutterella sp.]